MDNDVLKRGRGAEADRTRRGWTFAARSRLLVVAVLAALVFDTSYAEGTEEPSSAQRASSAAETGHAIGSAAREIGSGVVDTGRTVGHAVRDAAVMTWNHVSEAGRTIGQAARDGSRAFGRAIRGEKGGDER